MKTFLTFLVLTAAAVADPQLSSWHTALSGQYARLYTSTANESAGNAVTTWSRGTGVQSQPTYAGVHEISHSNDWVYIHTTGLAGHIMGPWYLDAAKTMAFPNFPSNTSTIYRIPRSPVIPAADSKSLTGLGAAGYYVNGVAMFDMRDAFSYSNSNGQDASPVAGIGQGDGVWNRDAYHNESVTFDAGFAHQAGNQYHYHAQPPGLRHQLGDHVSYDSASNVYSEMPGLPAEHSPILAWAADGLPLYGPYGYSDPLDPGSGISRMRSGYRLRSITTRTVLPAWAARVQGYTAIGTTSEYSLAANEYGPNVSTTYQLGHYLEDHEYMGDLGYAQGADFDLNEYNSRWCVTPEFPGGTWAYFLTIEADGTPDYPYATGREYIGAATGGAVTSISEAVTTFWQGGPNLGEEWESIAVNKSSGDVTIVWSAVEGGTYEVKCGDTPDTPETMDPVTLSGSNELAVVESGAASQSKRFYRVARTGLAAFDSTGFNYDGGGGGGGGTFDATFSTTPPLPPQNAVDFITIGGVTATITAYNQTTGEVSLTFDDRTLSAGSYPALLYFTPPGQSQTYKTSTNSYSIL